jgi:hypothetical protein
MTSNAVHNARSRINQIVSLLGGDKSKLMKKLIPKATIKYGITEEDMTSVIDYLVFCYDRDMDEYEVIESLGIEMVPYTVWGA